MRKLRSLVVLCACVALAGAPARAGDPCLGAGGPGLAVAGVNLAPATVNAGMPTSMYKLRLAASGGPVTVTGLTLRDVGSAPASGLSVQVLFGGRPMATTAVYAGATKTWQVLFASPRVLQAGQYLYLELQETAPPSAAGKTVCLLVAGVATDATITGELPMGSGVATVVSVPVLGASGYSVAPTGALWGTWVPLYKLRLQANYGGVTITGVRLRDVGSAPGASLALKVLVTGVEVPGTTTYDGLTKTWTLTPSQPVTLKAGYVSYLEIHEQASVDAVGRTMQASVPDAASVLTTAQVAGTFPLKSNATTVLGKLPTVTASAAPTTTLTGTTVVFGGRAVPDTGAWITRYEWDYTSDGTYDSSATTVAGRFVYAAPGAYTATLRATDNRGRSATASVGVTVSDPAAPQVTVTATPPTALHGDGVKLDATVTTGAPWVTIVGCDWDFDSNNTWDMVGAATPAVTRVYDAPGTYKATLRVRDSRGLSATGAVTVTVTPRSAPRVTVSATPNPATMGVAVALDGSATAVDPGVTIARYEWDFDGDGVFDWRSTTAAATTRTYTRTGAWNVILRATDSRGLASTASVRLVVVQNPPRVTPSATPQTSRVAVPVQFGGVVTAGDPGVTIAQYEWDFEGDGTWDTNSAVSAAASHAYPAAGTYTALLRATDSRGLTTTAGVSVVVTATLPTVTAHATPTATWAGDNVSFSGVAAVGDPGTTIARYEWDFNGDGTYDVASTGTADARHVYTAPGRYNARLRATDNRGLTATATVTVNIAAPNAPTVSVSATPTNGWRGVPVSFTAVANAGDPGATISRYAWDFNGDGTPDATSATTGAATHAYTEPAGSYTATLYITDSRGLTASASVAVTVQVAALAKTPWPKFHRDYANTGNVGGQGATGRLKWSYDTTAVVYSPPALSGDGLVLVGSNDRQLHAVEVATGQRRWAFPTTGGIIDSSAVVGPDGTVYFGSYDRSVYALDGKLGTRKWSTALGGTIYGTPTLSEDGTLYVGCYDNNLYALDSATGNQLWTFATSGQIAAAPAMGADGTIYVASRDNSVYAVDPATHRAKWTVKTGAECWNTPAVGPDGTVYFGSYDRRLYAIDGATGGTKWTFTAGGAIYSAPALGPDGTVYFGCQDNLVYAVDGTNGARKWTFTTGGPIYSSPAIGSDGTLYVGSDDDNVYAIDSATGSQRWLYTTNGNARSSVAVDADGTIYFGSFDGRLYCVGTDAPQPPTVTATATPNPVGVGLHVTFGGTATADWGGRIMRYEWDFEDDGTYDTTSTASIAANHPYTAPGTYTARVRVTDSRLQTATATVVVTVNAAPPRCSATAIPATAAVGQPVLFTGTASSGARLALYEWDFEDDGTYDVSSATVLPAPHAYPAEGTYTARLRVTDSQGLTATATATVTITAPVVGVQVTATASPTSARVGQTVNFGGSARSSAQFTLFEWDFEDDGTYDANSPTAIGATHAYTAAGTYTARLRVTDAQQQTGEATVTVTITAGGG